MTTFSSQSLDLQLSIYFLKKVRKPFVDRNGEVVLLHRQIKGTPGGREMGARGELELHPPGPLLKARGTKKRNLKRLSPNNNPNPYQLINLSTYQPINKPFKLLQSWQTHNTTQSQPNGQAPLGASGMARSSTTAQSRRLLLVVVVRRELPEQRVEQVLLF